DVQAHVMQDLDRILLGEKADVEIPDLEEVLAHRRVSFLIDRRQRCCGSVTVRSQLAMILSESVVIMIMRPGKKESHQAVCRYWRPAATMAPQVKSGGWMPRPRKLSPDSERMTPAKLIAATVVSVGATSGTTCRTTMANVPTPSVRAALTNMRSRI